jgi:steroid 5-alpha reductase family enzyme
LRNTEAAVGERHEANDKARALGLVVVAYLVAFAVAWIACARASGMHPIATALVADVAATIAIFAFSYAFNNSSFYDAYWSVAPLPIALYWWYVAAVDGASTLRALLVFAAIAAWGSRLTYNWVRGWTGLDHEDWRYRKLAEQAGSRYWLVSFFGIHLMPTLWVFGGLLPVWPAVAVGTHPLGLLDLLAAAVAVGAIWIEARADKELLAFRRSNRQPGEILATGLWALSRHPNYFGEMSFWWSLFLFGLAADPGYAWTGAGALAITAMFRFVSLPMMEERSLERRPGYAEHQKRTSLVVPWPKVF